VQVIPSIDLDRGRSRVVFWPGASSGVGAPTDRPDRIAEQLVATGARVIHLVDFDGARSGRPENLEAIGGIASRVAVPLQVAGGVDSADGIRLAFAAGATRVVASMAIADDPSALAAALDRFGAILRARFGDRLLEVVLFGSRARGEAGPDSDYDVAVFLTALPDRWAELDRLADLRVRFLDETGAFFDAKPYAAAVWREASPLMHEIRREGLEL
jgi:predicted nucleotidyltransferase